MEIELEALELMQAEVDGLSPCNPRTTCGESCGLSCSFTCFVTGG